MTIKYSILFVISLLLFTSCDLDTNKTHVSVEISYSDIIKNLANNSNDPILIEVLSLTESNTQASDTTFINAFGETWENTVPFEDMWKVFSEKYVNIFEDASSQKENKNVLNWLNNESEVVIEKTVDVLCKRISHFTSKKIKMDREKKSGHINFRLRGLKIDPEELTEVLQTTGNFGFWETFEYNEIVEYLVNVNRNLNSFLPDSDTLRSPSLLSLLSMPTNSYSPQGAIIGVAKVEDTALINSYLRMPEVIALLPHRFSAKWSTLKQGEYLELFAIKNTKKAALDYSYIIDVSVEKRYGYEVIMEMNKEGTGIFKRLTENNIGKVITILLDDRVYSAPMVCNSIEEGNACVSGNFTEEEADSFAAMLKSGKLPVPIKVINIR